MITQYFRWHYGPGFMELIYLSRNLFSFLAHFFSFKLLFFSLFSPWKKMGEHYKRGFDVESLISSFIVNSIMRVVGFFARSVVIISGLISSFALLVLSFSAYILWLLIPFVLVTLFASSFFLIYASVI
ncbi:MAG TPA: hypothetical protein VJH67_00490 [Candidatus Paceibacterota bacterium]